MQIDFSEVDSLAAYRTFVQTIVPRPIAWILSDNGNRSFNLAPFSFFNAVTSKPPVISVSIGHRADGSKKDTWRNIELRKYFTLHIASKAQAELVSATAASFPPGESEIVKCRIPTVNEDGFQLPRLADTQVAMACELYRVIEVGEAGQGLILGRVNRVYIKDDLVSDCRESPGFQMDYKLLDPLARLGGNDFAGITRSFTVERPD